MKTISDLQERINTTTLQQLLHDLYQQLMMPEEKNVVSLANRILDAKAELAKGFTYVPPVTAEQYYGRKSSTNIEPINIEQRTPSDLGEVH